MHSSPIHKAPGLIVLLPFMTGIIVAKHFEIAKTTIIFSTILCFFILFIFQFIKIRKRSFSNHLFLFFSIITISLLGIYRFQSTSKIYEFEKPMKAEFCATITCNPIEKENSYRIDLIVDSLYIKSETKALNIGTIAYFAKSEDAKKLLPGECIRFKSELKAPAPPLNPEGFDYKTFLYEQNIFATCYVSSENWEKLDYKHFTLKIAASRVQNYVVEILKTQNYEKEELALISALTVGYKQLIDTDQRESYMISGATHVLAVSGLHVGIIYIFLLQVFKIFGNGKKRKFCRTILIVILLWCFAFITGLTPSVARATLMFSMVALGQITGQQSNTFNTLFLSAFILLFINPKLISSLSFLLSYTALLGILAFQPLIAKFLIEKCRIPKFLGELTAVSIAAQIGTSPLSIHTFNAFPNYFIFTNIWIIPLVYIIVNGAVILILISLINIPSGFISIPLEWALKLMNFGVDWISNLPYALSNYIYIDKVSVMLFYILMILLLFAINNNSKRYLLCTIICIFILLTHNFLSLYNEKDVQKLYAFSNRENFNISAQQGLKSNILHDINTELEMPDYFIKRFLSKRNLSIGDIKQSYESYNVKRVNDFILTPNALYATYSSNLEKHSRPIKLEALFIVNEEPQNIYKLYETLKFNTLVFHQKPDKHINYFKSFCHKNKIRLHLLYQDGAYIMPL